jgi:hypothetical protein
MRKRRVRRHLRRTKDGITPVRQHFRKYQKVKKLNKPQPAKEIKRKCFRCDKVLKFDEFISANISKSKEYLTDIWFDEEVELYCCGCFDIGMAKSPQDFIEKTESMTKRLREAKELGIDLAEGVVEDSLDDYFEDYIEEHGEDDADKILDAIKDEFQYEQSDEFADSIVPTLKLLSGFEAMTFEEMESKFISGIATKMREDFDKLYPKYLEAYKKKRKRKEN